MEERIKQMKSQGKKTNKFDTVVAREVCQLTTPGTRVSNFMDSKTFEGEPRYLWAITESIGGELGLTYGVAFIDTTIGTFHLGQFSDDKNLSRLRTVAAHYPPAEILFEKNGLSSVTMRYLSSSLPTVRYS
jgi:DNA mismatch repair protein MSH6